MNTPGKYDDVCTYVREQTNAMAVVVMVVNGDLGSGFSIQSIDPEIISAIPEFLEMVISEMRKDETKRSK